MVLRVGAGPLAPGPGGRESSAAGDEAGAASHCGTGPRLVDGAT
ncbi:hypothetical protein HMPREF9005_1821 [Actinomyces sp. oral taxon 178 str. F0338]|nr:hypothetical protein HMPREF9005_1821 [Actinomyces sp. oral taxon 178 str. F0338]